MKGIIFTFIFTISFIASFSQITLTNATHGFKNGDKVNYLLGNLLGDTTGFNPGTGGAAKTWNFNTLPTPTFSLSEKYQSVASTPYGINFPTATTAVFDSFSVLDSTYLYTYYKVDTSGINKVGTEDLNMILNYNNNELLMKFPFTFNSDSKDSFSGIGIDTSIALQVIRKGSIHVFSDGYGTLILPGKTFNNVLRVRSVEIIDDYLIDTEFGDTFEIDNYKTQIYQWYISSQKIPVFQYNSETYLSSLDSGFVDSSKTIIINKDAFLSIESENNPLSTVIYPNPCKDELNMIIPNQLTGQLQISIINIDGKILKSSYYSTIQGINQLKIDTHDLTPGIYAIRMISGNQSTTQKIIKK